jgi:hypothetical protein
VAIEGLERVAAIVENRREHPASARSALIEVDNRLGCVSTFQFDEPEQVRGVELARLDFEELEA